MQTKESSFYPRSSSLSFLCFAFAMTFSSVEGGTKRPKLKVEGNQLPLKGEKICLQTLPPGSPFWRLLALQSLRSSLFLAKEHLRLVLPGRDPASVPVGLIQSYLICQSHRKG